MFRVACCLCAALLLALPLRTAQAADASTLINRLTLIPAAPGGSAQSPPDYAPDALPPASFEVLLNNELAGDSPEEYYLGRARLLAASYRVLVFRAADYRPLYSGRPPRPLAVIGPDAAGVFRIDQAGLAPGNDYAWLVTATVEDGRSQTTLWSVPLYFRLLPDALRIPQLLPPADQLSLRSLLLLTAQQERANECARIGLRGLAQYYNFAAASDTFFCAPLDEGVPSPWPDAAAGGVPLLALQRLGDVASEALVLQRQPQQPGALGRARTLGTQVQQLAAGLGGAAGDAGTGAAGNLSGAGKRLAAVDAGDVPALLSELFIALDGAAGTGTRPMPPTGLASFPPYARATVRRLESVDEFALQLQASMTPDDWAAWTDALRQLRAELTIMADDVERGRLNLQQLEVQLARARQIVAPVYSEEWRFIDRATGVIDAERVSRLRPEEAEQRRRLARELYWYHLTRLTRLLLPSAGNNPG